jgi:hypothetical protein
MVLPAHSNKGHQILRAGDSLNYSITGSSNNTAFTSNYNFTIGEAEESGISYQSRLIIPPEVAVIPTVGHDFVPYWAMDRLNNQNCIGTEKIETSFGLKSVKEFFYFDNGEAILYDIGLDSLIVYRWIVSSASGEYNYIFELAETNNTKISSVDTVMQPVDIKGLNAPSLAQGTMDVFRLMERAWGYGSVEVGKGQQLHYIAAGNITVYVFTIADLRSIEMTGQFRFNASLSRLAGDPGETNVTVEPGTYWYVMNYQGAETTIPSPPYVDAEDVGGYFLPWWHN